MKPPCDKSPIEVRRSGLFGRGQIMNAPRPFGYSRSNLSARPDSLCRYGAYLTFVLVCVLCLTGCASRPVPGQWMQSQSAALKNRLLQLDSEVDAEDAEHLAQVAVEQSAALAHQYRAVQPPWLGNYLVNMGWRERGLCYDWANGLYPRLHGLGLRSLDLHLAVARMDTRHEHNCIVVTPRDHPFSEGVVLDAWRRSGRLWFGSVSTDKYPWQPLPRDRVPRELEKLVKQ